MAKLDALSPPPCFEVEAQRLFDICALLESLGAGPYRVIPHDSAGSSESLRLMPGWLLTGGANDDQRRAAADLVRCLFRVEEEIQSLSAEINERYELVARTGETAPLLGNPGEEAARVALDEARPWTHEEGTGERAVVAVPLPGSNEARDAQRRFYTLERLLRVVRDQRESTAVQIRQRLLDDLERHRRRQPAHDDVTLIVIRCVEDGACAGGDGR